MSTKGEPGGLDEGEIGHSSPGPGTPARAWTGTGAALVAIALLVIVAVLSSRCDRAGTGEPVGELGELAALGAPGSVALEQEPPRRRVQGRVLRELPSELPSPSGPGPAALADADIVELLDGLPDWELQPPGELGCRVRAWQGGELVAAEAVCSAEGDYELSVSGDLEGAVQLELEIPGQLRGVIEQELSPEIGGSVEAPRVALGPGHFVLGQAVDARGEALAGVQIQALPRPVLEGSLPWRTVSDEQGHFEFTTLPYGPVNLRGIKPGYALSVVEAVAPEDRVLLVLDALIDLEGEVFVSAAQRELLARAVVRLEGSSVWPAIEQPLAETGGAFVFADLPDGIYGVEVSVPAATPGGQDYASVPLENITPDLHVALALVPAFRVPVRVVDPDGEAIRGARVTLGYSQLGMLQKIAETDVEGRARVGPVVPGPYLVHADADGFLPPEPVEVEVGPEGFVADEQVLVLIRPAKLEGIVVDEDDRPVAGAEVLLDSDVEFTVGEGDSRRQLFAVALGAESGSLGVTRGEVPDIPLFAEDEHDGSSGVVITDAQGRFEIDLLLPGVHRVWAVHGEHAASAVESFELRSGELRGGLRLQLREGVPLTGVVRSENGEPLAGAQVDLGDGLVLSTDARGVFDAGFRRGAQTVVVRAPGMIPQALVVDLGAESVDLAVALAPASARVEGRVVDGNNQPIADVEVELYASDELSPSRITWTDARGVYEFEDLAPGKVALEFRHGDYIEGESGGLAALAKGPLADVELAAGWRVAVLVRSAVRGEAIAGVSVRAESSEATTDKSGRALLQRLVGERVEVEAEAAGWVSARVEVRDDGSGEVGVTIELTDGGSLEGTIDDDLGDPVSGATIEIRASGGALLGTTKSDGRGGWRVDGVPEGDVVIRATPPTSLEAVLAPLEQGSDVIRGEVTRALRLRFNRQ